MKLLTLYAMSAKGYAVAEHLLSHYPQMVAHVVTSSDAGVKQDYRA